MRASGLAAEVYADDVPLLPDVVELTAAGYVSGGTQANISYLTDAVEVADDVPTEIATLAP